MAIMFQTRTSTPAHDGKATVQVVVRDNHDDGEPVVVGCNDATAIAHQQPPNLDAKALNKVLWHDAHVF